MDKKVKKLLVEALESGEYVQTQGKLINTINGKDSFCCIGVLCDLHIRFGPPEAVENWIDKCGWCYGTKDEYNYTELNYNSVATWADLDAEDETMLIRLNDGGESFKDIAEFINKNL